MLKAHIKISNKLTSLGQVSNIKCQELNLEVLSIHPERKLCRTILEKYPERSSEELKIYRDGKHTGTIKSIKRFAQKTIRETDTKRLHEVPYRKPPSQS